VHESSVSSVSGSSSEKTSVTGEASKSVLAMLVAIEAINNKASYKERQRSMWLKRKLLSEEMPISIYYQIMRLAVEEGFGREAVDAAKALLKESSYNYQREFTKIMHILRSSGQYDLTLELFQAFRHQIDNRIPYNVALGVCQTQELWSEAIDLLKEMRKFQPQAQDNSMALDTVARTGRWQQTLELYDELLAQGQATSISTYTIVFRACVEMEDTTRATKYLRKMKADGIEANPFIQRTVRSLAKNIGSPQYGSYGSPVGL
jgi:pentatricopeptide repeat protein